MDSFFSSSSTSSPDTRTSSREGTIDRYFDKDLFSSHDVMEMFRNTSDAVNEEPCQQFLTKLGVLLEDSPPEDVIPKYKQLVFKFIREMVSMKNFNSLELYLPNIMQYTQQLYTFNSLMETETGVNDYFKFVSILVLEYLKTHFYPCTIIGGDKEQGVMYVVLTYLYRNEGAIMDVLFQLTFWLENSLAKSHIHAENLFNLIRKLFNSLIVQSRHYLSAFHTNLSIMNYIRVLLLFKVLKHLETECNAANASDVTIVLSIDWGIERVVLGLPIHRNLEPVWGLLGRVFPETKMSLFRDKRCQFLTTEDYHIFERIVGLLDFVQLHAESIDLKGNFNLKPMQGATCKVSRKNIIKLKNQPILRTFNPVNTEPSIKKNCTSRTFNPVNTEPSIKKNCTSRTFNPVNTEPSIKKNCTSRTFNPVNTEPSIKKNCTSRMFRRHARPQLPRTSPRVAIEDEKQLLMTSNCEETLLVCSVLKNNRLNDISTLAENLVKSSVCDITEKHFKMRPPPQHEDVINRMDSNFTTPSPKNLVKPPGNMFGSAPAINKIFGDFSHSSGDLFSNYSALNNVGQSNPVDQVSSGIMSLVLKDFIRPNFTPALQPNFTTGLQPNFTTGLQRNSTTALQRNLLTSPKAPNSSIAKCVSSIAESVSLKAKSSTITGSGNAEKKETNIDKTEGTSIHETHTSIPESLSVITELPNIVSATPVTPNSREILATDLRNNSSTDLSNNVPTDLSNNVCTHLSNNSCIDLSNNTSTDLINVSTYVSNHASTNSPNIASTDLPNNAFTDFHNGVPTDLRNYVSTAPTSPNSNVSLDDAEELVVVEEVEEIVVFDGIGEEDLQNNIGGEGRQSNISENQSNASSIGEHDYAYKRGRNEVVNEPIEQAELAREKSTTKSDPRSVSSPEQNHETIPLRENSSKIVLEKELEDSNALLESSTKSRETGQSHYSLDREDIGRSQVCNCNKHAAASIEDQNESVDTDKESYKPRKYNGRSSLVISMIGNSDCASVENILNQIVQVVIVQVATSKETSVNESHLVEKTTHEEKFARTDPVPREELNVEMQEQIGIMSHPVLNYNEVNEHNFDVVNCDENKGEKFQSNDLEKDECHYPITDDRIDQRHDQEAAKENYLRTTEVICSTKEKLETNIDEPHDVRTGESWCADSTEQHVRNEDGAEIENIDIMTSTISGSGNAAKLAAIEPSGISGIRSVSISGNINNLIQSSSSDNLFLSLISSVNVTANDKDNTVIVSDAPTSGAVIDNRSEANIPESTASHTLKKETNIDKTEGTSIHKTHTSIPESLSVITELPNIVSATPVTPNSREILATDLRNNSSTDLSNNVPTDLSNNVCTHLSNNSCIDLSNNTSTDLINVSTYVSNHASTNLPNIASTDLPNNAFTDFHNGVPTDYVSTAATSPNSNVSLDDAEELVVVEEVEEIVVFDGIGEEDLQNNIGGEGRQSNISENQSNASSIGEHDYAYKRGRNEVVNEPIEQAELARKKSNTKSDPRSVSSLEQNHETIPLRENSSKIVLEKELEDGNALLESSTKSRETGQSHYSLDREDIGRSQVSNCNKHDGASIEDQNESVDTDKESYKPPEYNGRSSLVISMLGNSDCASVENILNQIVQVVIVQVGTSKETSVNESHLVEKTTHEEEFARTDPVPREELNVEMQEQIDIMSHPVLNYNEVNEHNFDVVNCDEIKGEKFQSNDLEKDECHYPITDDRIDQRHDQEAAKENYLRTTKVICSTKEKLETNIDEPHDVRTGESWCADSTEQHVRNEDGAEIENIDIMTSTISGSGNAAKLAAIEPSGISGIRSVSISGNINNLIQSSSSDKLFLSLISSVNVTANDKDNTVIVSDAPTSGAVIDNRSEANIPESTASHTLKKETNIDKTEGTSIHKTHTSIPESLSVITELPNIVSATPVTPNSREILATDLRNNSSTDLSNNVPTDLSNNVCTHLSNNSCIDLSNNTSTDLINVSTYVSNHASTNLPNIASTDLPNNAFTDFHNGVPTDYVSTAATSPNSNVSLDDAEELVVVEEVEEIVVFDGIGEEDLQNNIGGEGRQSNISENQSNASSIGEHDYAYKRGRNEVVNEPIEQAELARKKSNTKSDPRSVSSLEQNHETIPLRENSSKIVLEKELEDGNALLESSTKSRETGQSHYSLDREDIGRSQVSNCNKHDGASIEDQNESVDTDKESYKPPEYNGRSSLVISMLGNSDCASVENILNQIVQVVIVQVGTSKETSVNESHLVEKTTHEEEFARTDPVPREELNVEMQEQIDIMSHPVLNYNEVNEHNFDVVNCDEIKGEKFQSNDLEKDECHYPITDDRIDQRHDQEAAKENYLRTTKVICSTKEKLETNIDEPHDVRTGESWCADSTEQHVRNEDGAEIENIDIMTSTISGSGNAAKLAAIEPSGISGIRSVSISGNINNLIQSSSSDKLFLSLISSVNVTANDKDNTVIVSDAPTSGAVIDNRSEANIPESTASHTLKKETNIDKTEGTSIHKTHTSIPESLSVITELPNIVSATPVTPNSREILATDLRNNSSTDLSNNVPTDLSNNVCTHLSNNSCIDLSNNTSTDLINVSTYVSNHASTNLPNIASTDLPNNAFTDFHNGVPTDYVSTAATSPNSNVSLDDAEELVVVEEVEEIVVFDGIGEEDLQNNIGGEGRQSNISENQSNASSIGEHDYAYKRGRNEVVNEPIEQAELAREKSNTKSDPRSVSSPEQNHETIPLRENSSKIVLEKELEDGNALLESSSKSRETGQSHYSLDREDIGRSQVSNCNKHAAASIEDQNKSVDTDKESYKPREYYDRSSLVNSMLGNSDCASVENILNQIVQVVENLAKTDTRSDELEPFCTTTTLLEQDDKNGFAEIEPDDLVAHFPRETIVPVKFNGRNVAHHLEVKHTGEGNAVRNTEFDRNIDDNVPAMLTTKPIIQPEEETYGVISAIDSAGQMNENEPATTEKEVEIPLPMERDSTMNRDNEGNRSVIHALNILEGTSKETSVNESHLVEKTTHEEEFARTDPVPREELNVEMQEQIDIMSHPVLNYNEFNEHNFDVVNFDENKRENFQSNDLEKDECHYPITDDRIDQRNDQEAAKENYLRTTEVICSTKQKLETNIDEPHDVRTGESWCADSTGQHVRNVDGAEIENIDIDRNSACSNKGSDSKDSRSSSNAIVKQPLEKSARRPYKRKSVDTNDFTPTLKTNVANDVDGDDGIFIINQTACQAFDTTVKNFNKKDIVERKSLDTTNLSSPLENSFDESGSNDRLVFNIPPRSYEALEIMVNNVSKKDSKDRKSAALKHSIETFSESDFDNRLELNIPTTSDALETLCDKSFDSPKSSKLSVNGVKLKSTERKIHKRPHEEDAEGAKKRWRMYKKKESNAKEEKQPETETLDYQSIEVTAEIHNEPEVTPSSKYSDLKIIRLKDLSSLLEIVAGNKDLIDNSDIQSVIQARDVNFNSSQYNCNMTEDTLLSPLEQNSVDLEASTESYTSSEWNMSSHNSMPPYLSYYEYNNTMEYSNSLKQVDKAETFTNFNVNEPTEHHRVEDKGSSEPDIGKKTESEKLKTYYENFTVSERSTRHCEEETHAKSMDSNKTQGKYPQTHATIFHLAKSSLLDKNSTHSQSTSVVKKNTSRKHNIVERKSLDTTNLSSPLENSFDESGSNDRLVFNIPPRSCEALEIMVNNVSKKDSKDRKSAALKHSIETFSESDFDNRLELNIPTTSDALEKPCDKSFDSPKSSKLSVNGVKLKSTERKIHKRPHEEDAEGAKKRWRMYKKKESNAKEEKQPETETLDFQSIEVTAEIHNEPEVAPSSKYSDLKIIRLKDLSSLLEIVAGNKNLIDNSDIQSVIQARDVNFNSSQYNCNMTEDTLLSPLEQNSVDLEASTESYTSSEWTMSSHNSMLPYLSYYEYNNTMEYSNSLKQVNKTETFTNFNVNEPTKHHRVEDKGSSEPDIGKKTENEKTYYENFTVSERSTRQCEEETHAKSMDSNKTQGKYPQTHSTIFHLAKSSIFDKNSTLSHCTSVVKKNTSRKHKISSIYNNYNETVELNQKTPPYLTLADLKSGLLENSVSELFCDVNDKISHNDAFINTAALLGTDDKLFEESSSSEVSCNENLNQIIASLSDDTNSSDASRKKNEKISPKLENDSKRNMKTNSWQKSNNLENGFTIEGTNSTNSRLQFNIELGLEIMDNSELRIVKSSVRSKSSNPMDNNSTHSKSHIKTELDMTNTQVPNTCDQNQQTYALHHPTQATQHIHQDKKQHLQKHEHEQRKSQYELTHHQQQQNHQQYQQQQHQQLTHQQQQLTHQQQQQQQQNHQQYQQEIRQPKSSTESVPWIIHNYDQTNANWKRTEPQYNQVEPRCTSLYMIAQTQTRNSQSFTHRPVEQSHHYVHQKTHQQIYSTSLDPTASPSKTTRSYSNKRYPSALSTFYYYEPVSYDCAGKKRVSSVLDTPIPPANRMMSIAEVLGQLDCNPELQNKLKTISSSKLK